MVFLYLLVIIICSFGISKSGALVVSAVSKLAQRARISDFTLGFFVLGLSTSTPELFVGINAAFDKVPQLSFGNVIGGIIVLLTLIIGITAVVTGKVSFRGTFSPKELLLTAFLIISPCFLILDGFLSRFDGLLFISFYIVYFVIMNRKETFLEKVRDQIFKQPVNIGKLIVKLTIGTAGLILFSKIIVDVAILLSNQFAIPLVLVGFLLLSIGTNLPELSLGILSRNDHKEIAIGDYLGSAAANVLILGIVVTICPFIITNTTKVLISVGVLTLSVIAFSVFANSKRLISRNEGIILLFIYLLFVISEIASNSWAHNLP